MATWLRTGLVLAAFCCVAAGCGDNDNNDNGGGLPTATPTPAPTATATPPPQIPCPQLVTYSVVAADSDLDTGWTGIYGDQPAGDGGSLTFAVDCPGEFLGQCGVCALSGPVQSTTIVNNHRCANATEVTCETDADCPGSTCSFFFGSPLAVSGGGIPICVTNRVANQVTGTLSPELGQGNSDFDLELTFFTGIAVDQPCPVCSGTEIGASGTCSGGARDGEACTTDALGVLGDTSFDCPPNPGANIGSTIAPLDLTTGTRSLEATERCTGIGGGDCYCEGQIQPNACTDAVCTVEESGQGVCESGPIDQVCEIEFFRSCLTDDDCPAEGDSCIDKPRTCLGPADASGTTGPLTRTGEASTSLPLQVSVFCLNGTSSQSVNAAAGLPGPGAIALPTSICIFAECPVGGESE